MTDNAKTIKVEEGPWKELHESMTGVMLVLIVIHLAGVLVPSWVHGENLILAMLAGKKRRE